MRLRIQLRSDSAFGRGDGIAGLVDSEVEHDSRTGFPFIKGRTIKGLLVESCADILYALRHNDEHDAFAESAETLFGIAGSTYDDIAGLHIGKAELPEDFRNYVLSRGRYSPQQLLEAFTSIRHQTAVDSTTGIPKDGSLRAIRTVLRETIFYAPLQAMVELAPRDIALLAACAAGVKRGGQNRTRGLGWLKTSLDDIDGNPLDDFIEMIGGNIR